ncbi:hypothetical protein ACJJTC_012969 [Scirpophaga incertulas]
MDDIFDKEEIDQDTVKPDVLDSLFDKKYYLVTESPVRESKLSYINKIHGTRSFKFAVSTSNNNGIEIFDLQKDSLSPVCRLSGHTKSLTEVVFSPKEDHLLYSAGNDGLLKLWDLRAGGSCAQEYKDKEDELIRPFECMDVACNGRILCAGSQVVEDEAYLIFWDQRMPKPLGGYWNTHQDDITQVKFHKEKAEILVTGANDGLLNVYNVLEETEDDALSFSMNVQNSVEKLTWLNSIQIACVTQSNDFQIWDTTTGDLVRSYSREKVAKGIKRSKEDDCYIVDAFTTAEDATVLLAGSHGGDEETLRSVTVAEKKLKPYANFKENSQIVRCCLYYKDPDLLVTAGEAGRLSVWSGRCGPRAPRKATHPNNRYKPY